MSPRRTLSCSTLGYAKQNNVNPEGASTVVYELRVYRAAPGKLGELLARFRDHTMKLCDRHGIKNVAYWTAVDEIAEEQDAGVHAVVVGRILHRALRD